MSVKKSKVVKKRRTRKKTSAPVGEKHAGGRPPAEIDKKLLEQLCAIQCTQAEIAAVLGLSRRTIERYAVEDGYREIFQNGREIGKVSVRRKQFELMNAGSVGMAIWLGKQLLGQRDEVNVKTDPNSTTYAGLLTTIAMIDQKKREKDGSGPTVN